MRKLLNVFVANGNAHACSAAGVGVYFAGVAYLMKRTMSTNEHHSDQHHSTPVPDFFGSLGEKMRRDALQSGTDQKPVLRNQ